MRICVTGSSGQIGSYVVDHAREEGHETVGLDLRPSAWTTHVGDIRRAADCEAAVAGCDAVIHCAAHVSVQGSVEDPLNDLDHNVVGTVRLLEACRAAGVRAFLLTSSAAVYGAPIELPIREDHPTVPLSPYGASKLACEHYARLYSELHGMRVVIARPFNVYSKRQDPTSPYSGVMSKFAERVRAGKPPVIYGDGTQTRDFIHAGDVARWMVRLASEGTSEALLLTNLGTGIETSVNELALRFMAAAGLAGEPQRGPARVGEVNRSVASVKVSNSRTLMSPIVLADGIHDLVS